MQRRLSVVSMMLALSVVVTARDASAEWLTGSTFTLQGMGAPNDFTQTITLAPGTTTIDNGALILTQTIYDVAGHQQWLDLYIRPSEGHQLDGDPAGLWGFIATGVKSSAPQPFGGMYDYFTENGTAAPTPISHNPTIPVVANPVNPALGLVYEWLMTSERSTSTTAGFFMGPYSEYLAHAGMDPAAINGFHLGILLDPTNTDEFVPVHLDPRYVVMDGAPVLPSPEPSTMVSASLGGLMVLAYTWRRRRQARVVM